MASKKKHLDSTIKKAMPERVPEKEPHNRESDDATITRSSDVQREQQQSLPTFYSSSSRATSIQPKEFVSRYGLVREDHQNWSPYGVPAAGEDRTAAVILSRRSWIEGRDELVTEKFEMLKEADHLVEATVLAAEEEKAAKELRKRNKRWPKKKVQIQLGTELDGTQITGEANHLPAFNITEKLSKGASPASPIWRGRSGTVAGIQLRTETERATATVEDVLVNNAAQKVKETTPLVNDAKLVTVEDPVKEIISSVIETRKVKETSSLVKNIKNTELFDTSDTAQCTILTNEGSPAKRESPRKRKVTARDDPIEESSPIKKKMRRVKESLSFKRAPINMRELINEGEPVEEMELAKDRTPIKKREVLKGEATIKMGELIDSTNSMKKEEPVKQRNNPLKVRRSVLEKELTKKKKKKKHLVKEEELVEEELPHDKKSVKFKESVEKKAQIKDKESNDEEHSLEVRRSPRKHRPTQTFEFTNEREWSKKLKADIISKYEQKTKSNWRNSSTDTFQSKQKISRTYTRAPRVKTFRCKPKFLRSISLSPAEQASMEVRFVSVFKVLGFEDIKSNVNAYTSPYPLLDNVPDKKTSSDPDLASAISISNSPLSSAVSSVTIKPGMGFCMKEQSVLLASEFDRRKDGTLHATCRKCTPRVVIKIRLHNGQ